MFKKLRKRILVLNAATICLVMTVAFGAIYIMTARELNGQNDDYMKSADLSYVTIGLDGEIPFLDGYQEYYKGYSTVPPVSTSGAWAWTNTEDASFVSPTGAAPMVFSEATNFFANGTSYARIMLTAGNSNSAPETIPWSTDSAIADRYGTRSEKARKKAIDEAWQRWLDAMNDPEDTSAGSATNGMKEGKLTTGGRTWLYSVEANPHGFFRIAVRYDDGSTGEDPLPADYDGTNKYRVKVLDITETIQQLRELLLRMILLGAGALAILILISFFVANSAMAPVREAWNRQRRFIADASHELKTPLMTISANHDALLAHEDETVGSQRKWIDYARAGTERMNKLISALLALASAEDDSEAESIPGKKRFLRKKRNGAGTPDPAAETDIAAILDEEFGVLRAQAEQKDLRIVNHDDNHDDAENDSPAIRISPSVERAVRRIVSILADNAVKYADKGGAVEYSLSRKGAGKPRNKIVITITNTGVGIAQDDLPHIFERFYRADKARAAEAGGYGLGLSIAKALADRNNFTLTAESNPNARTIFRLTIPQ